MDKFQTPFIPSKQNLKFASGVSSTYTSNNGNIALLAPNNTRLKVEFEQNGF